MIQVLPAEDRPALRVHSCSEKRSVVLELVEHFADYLAAYSLFLEAFKTFHGFLLLVEFQIAVCKVNIQTVVLGIVADQIRQTFNGFFVFSFAFADEGKTERSVNIKIYVERLAVIVNGCFIVAGIAVCVSGAGQNDLVVRIKLENTVPVVDRTILLIHAAIAVGHAEQRIEVVRIQFKGAFKVGDTLIECLEFSVTVADRCEYADIYRILVKLKHFRPVIERILVFLEVIMKMTKADERVCIVLFHVEYFEIEFFRFFEVAYLAVGIGNPGKHRDVAVVMLEIFFPDSDRLVVLVKGFVTVCKTEKRIIVSRMKRETVVVVLDCVIKVILLPFRVSQSYKRVVIIVFQRQYFVERFFRFLYLVVFQKLVALF